MALAQFIGRKGQLYVAEESVFNTAPTILATHAYRHLNIDLSSNPFNRAVSAEKKQTPGTQNRYSRRATAGFDLKDSYLIPSGVLNTLPEASAILRNGFGSERSVVLSTTIASGATATGATLTSAAGLAPNDPIQITHAGVVYLRFLTTVAGNVVAWAPALPLSAANADAVKGTVGYQFATDLQKTLSVAHYLGTFSRIVTGGAVDVMKFMLDGMGEIKWNASGPAATQTRPAPSQPGFTTVGTTIPTGFTGALLVNGVAYKGLKATISVKNGFVLRNEDFAGGVIATEAYRSGRRVVDVTLDARVEDPTVIYAIAESITAQSLFLQCGLVSGKMWGFYMPLVEWDVPSTPDSDDVPTWSFKGTAIETTGNDELFVAQG